MSHHCPSIIGLTLWTALACRSAPKTQQEVLQESSSPSAAPSHGSSCPGYDTAQVNISADSIGPIALDSSLGAVARVCPGYRTQSDYVETTEILDWVFDLGSIRVTATQFDTAVNMSKPAENWQVFGRPILPDKVPLPAAWGALRTHYAGPAKLQLGELGPIARICELPWLEFSLEFAYGAADVDTMTAASIPATASIRSLFIHKPGNTEPC